MNKKEFYTGQQCEARRILSFVLTVLLILLSAFGGYKMAQRWAAEQACLDRRETEAVGAMSSCYRLPFQIKLYSRVGGEAMNNKQELTDELLLWKRLVRCKDCKNADIAYCLDHKTISRTEIYCIKDEYRHEKNWFCADGERKEGAD